MENSKTFRGGLRTGSSYLYSANFSWPLVILVISNSNLTVSVFKIKYVFPKTSIRLHQYRGFLSEGIKIEHDLQDVNEFIVFWTGQRQLIMDCLVSYGWQVEATCEKLPGAPVFEKLSEILKIGSYLIYPMPIVFLAVLFTAKKYLLEKGLADITLSAFVFTSIMAVAIFLYRRFRKLL